MKRSDPYTRVIATKQANPSLASQAPNVRIIKAEYISPG